MTVNNISVDILCGKGSRPVRQYLYEGKTFIEAREGTEYELEIRNNNFFRVMVVASVDGLDVITGKPATKSGGGYVVEAWGLLKIKGFRKSLEEIGSFKFTKKESSYAAEKGGENNVGVISIAAFKEKQPVYTYTSNTIPCTNLDMTWYESDNSCRGTTTTYNMSYNVIPTASASSDYKIKATSCYPNVTRSVDTPFQAGTTWGAQQKDLVKKVEFIKDSEIPVSEQNIYYDFKKGLELIGIKLIPDKNISFPNGFPQDSFATPPKGW